MLVVHVLGAFSPCTKFCVACDSHIMKHSYIGVDLVVIEISKSFDA